MFVNKSRFNNIIGIEKLKILKNEILNNYNLQNNEYYILNLDKHTIIRNDIQLNEAFFSKNPYNIFIQPRINGGILKQVIGFLFKIFDPIVKPLRMIADAFLMILRAIIYMALLVIWLIKFLVWFFTDFILSIPLDIITLSKRILYLVFDGLSSVIVLIVRKIGNKFGNMTLAAMSGADNVPDQSLNEENDADYFKKNSYQQKCYRTSDGQIPFSVIMATILCPPIGVFMEYGLFGWFNILICSLLTLAFYFPGLIYALILLYC